ncbi:hypothetical protein [Longivirga aurantiaca]|uniref:Uncharacterized protein n=1 Tax=Longivirga aurantiaca TaxID=1837743 RepID=A0ABW1T4G9_9ACTN
MSIFEGDDETEVDLGRVSELASAVPHDLRLDPLRGAIGALLDEAGTRVGTIVADVEVWWRKEGLLRRRDVDPRESVIVEVSFDPVALDDDGYPTVLPWVEASFEADDVEVADLLSGRLAYPDRDLAITWFGAGDAARERLAWHTRFDDPA